MHTDGPVYSHLINSKRGDGSRVYSAGDIACIQSTYKGLVSATSGTGAESENIGLLLGNIQSGKTKTFIGVIGLAFDNGFDAAVVLTKNSGALAEQTTRRIDKTFKSIPDTKIFARDVIKTPAKEGITVYEASHKNILIVKKQVHNVERAIELLSGEGQPLRGKRVLIVDDEADNASTTYYENKQEELQLAKVAKLINTLRTNVRLVHFLQVTATPYSLLLQNMGEAITGKDDLKSLRPKFCQLVPVSPDYVGSKYYFEDSKNPASPASKLFHEVDQAELDALTKQDGRRFQLSEWLTTKRLSGIRTALITFVMGVCLRRAQSKADANRDFALLVHTHAKKSAHAWQGDVVRTIINGLSHFARSDRFGEISGLFDSAYDDLSKSIKLGGHKLIDKNDALEMCKEALKSGWLHSHVINSDQDVERLLDRESGELVLNHPMTVFVGGNYLDRGVTINNLLGFYYGRSPKALQQDTVLQHCRQFGFRSEQDRAVTRFYTSKVLYGALERMHNSDKLLRSRIEEGEFLNGLYILEKLKGDAIKPCPISKIRASRINVVGASSKIYPKSFNTLKNARELDKITQRISAILAGAGIVNGGDKLSSTVSKQEAFEIIKLTRSSIQEFADGYEETWVEAEVQKLLDLMLQDFPGEGVTSDNVTVMVRWDRQRPQDVDDTPDHPKSDTPKARELADKGPVLALFHQSGGRGWNHVPFFWPMIFPPNNKRMLMYAMADRPRSAR